VKIRVLDSWAILEWINGQRPALDILANLLSEAELGKTKLLMSAINVGEVYYFLRKNHSDALAESWRESSGTMPMSIEVPTAGDIWHAASLKSRFPIAYADAFAAMLAQKHACPLVTGDPEFRRVKPLDVEWIGGNQKTP
jgi:predicted nucleic acid-binding protein